MNTCNLTSHIVKTSPIQLIQSVYEIVELLHVYIQLRPKYILEIGVADGGTLRLWMMCANSDATIIGVDVNAIDNGIREYMREGQSIHLLDDCNSYHKDTLDKVKNIIGDNKIDFLFIDGDHAYRGVRRDYEQYSPLVRDGGIIAFHDISARDVGMLWSELEARNLVRTIYDPWVAGGIGIIYVGMSI